MLPRPTAINELSDWVRQSSELGTCVSHSFNPSHTLSASPLISDHDALLLYMSPSDVITRPVEFVTL